MITLVALFYICVLALVLEYRMFDINNIQSNKHQKTINIIVIAIIILIAGTRNIGGTDYNVYKAVYNNVPKLNGYFADFNVLTDKYRVFGMDKGFLFFNSLCKTLRLSYYGFMLVHSTVIISIIYFVTRKYTNNYTIVIFIILYKMFFYDFFVSMRQTITIAIFMFMIKDIEERNWKHYMVLWLLCYFCHAASMMLLPVYFIGKLKLNKKLLIWLNIIFIPMIIVAYVGTPVLKLLDPILSFNIFGSEEIYEKADSLINGESASAINWLHTAEYFGIMFFLVKFYDEIMEISPKADTMIKLFLCLLPIFTLFRNYEILTRIKDYFTISYGFILSYLCMVKNGKYRMFVNVAVVAWCGFGYFRYVKLFDNGAMKKYVSNILLGRSFFE